MKGKRQRTQKINGTMIGFGKINVGSGFGSIAVLFI
jgi:hypothetical protein